ncbi:hypothetical protein BDK61_3655 [Haloarcula quadrata]|jgi:hypothetical protein|uniref:Uncharacterized protein n=3 Tax=Haloarcula TaxID=2237 RepID=Q5UWX4_HALMA|nr:MULTISPECIES: hypothetical protein [Haloarcula]AAV48229.1 unknown [Haloarcula marismortui ATCC 43049]EMA08967.1 hypothetical protein C436_19653 [Haloarcula sinaiiensis ATCC 33800]QCP89778.1 hypothetical protein E6P14_02495 [Haloarcula marismortui ATCC 43049]QUJ74178.1 hypothetical protein KDQ40_17095 [Haloarcula sinaiiensis ATCC 33800]RKS78020.1 hypothetical protein BDK61_3655 [Haloarcula quadrata]
MVFETNLYGFRVIELIASGFASGSAAVGLYIGFRSLQSFYRHGDPSMRYLAVGLLLLTAITYTVTFVGSILLQFRILSLPQQDYFLTVSNILQFAGLVCIAYALHRRD